METELEATFTQVNPEQVRARLRERGAELKKSERLMRRKNYDYPDKRLHAVSGWVRLRDEGDKVTLAYKQVHDRTLHGTKEVCIDVDDFERADKFLTAIGLAANSYQETKRESWVLDNVEVEIDTWPWISPYVEIEGKTEDDVRRVAGDLGFDWSAALYGSVENAYQEIYDVTEDDVDSWEEITFTPVPDWLEAKRRRE